MIANSLIIGLISYTASVIYNLFAKKSLEFVFFTGLRLLFITAFMGLFIQLSYLLIKDFNSKTDQKDFEKSKIQSDRLSDKNDRADINQKEIANQASASAIENEFEAEEFSTFNQEN